MEDTNQMYEKLLTTINQLNIKIDNITEDIEKLTNDVYDIYFKVSETPKVPDNSDEDGECMCDTPRYCYVHDNY
jgi:peptidoglycan hydrolase CwlO-like protein